MKVKTLIKFTDLKEGKERNVGEVFVVSKARFNEIIKAYPKPLVEEVAEEVTEEETKE